MSEGEVNMSAFLKIPETKIPVIAEADLVVVGGSCTGVFAAVRAARLGLDVVLVEKLNMLGGVATAGLVNVWHSLHDIYEQKQVIAGLTEETLQRLMKRSGAEKLDGVSQYAVPSHYNLNPWELTYVLDQYVQENKIRLLLHTSFVQAIKRDRKVEAVIVSNVDGLGAIKTKFVVDATGDGRVAKDLGCPVYYNDLLQPPTSCFLLQGEIPVEKWSEIVKRHGTEYGFSDDWGWWGNIAGLKDISLRADLHVFGVDCSKAADLTYAEMEGRRQTMTYLEMLNKYSGEDPMRVVAFGSTIGIRETAHYKTRYQANGEDLLQGKRYDAPIMNGTYRVDIHHKNSGGITFRYLDGREVVVIGNGTQVLRDDWRKRKGLTGDPAPYYQLPFEVFIGEEYDNFIAAGRMLNAEAEAFGAVRVMVNLNQIGEAAGTAAYVCLHTDKALQAIDGKTVTELLRKGGSAV
ncbi:MAG: FAD-dependent oxidoreductase [Clostridia bacterium]|nr:FAD-dependent oxidoreductase [Clostridia bacterium]